MEKQCDGKKGDAYSFVVHSSYICVYFSPQIVTSSCTPTIQATPGHGKYYLPPFPQKVIDISLKSLSITFIFKKSPIDAQTPMSRAKPATRPYPRRTTPQQPVLQSNQFRSYAAPAQGSMYTERINLRNNIRLRPSSGVSATPSLLERQQTPSHGYFKQAPNAQ